MRPTVLFLFCVMLTAACSKDPENPYSNVTTPTSNPDPQNLPTDNFAWLHQKIFRPNCAVSGCHDGTFEPDYRTISSAYNSLVYAPVISNDSAHTYAYRVLPGSADHSLLYARLTMFLPNTSGQMPLVVQNGSDWPANSASYIAKVHDWINNGAKDMFGSAPTLGDLQPQVTGFLAFPAGNTATPYTRDTTAGVPPILVHAANTDLWFSLTDDHTAAASLTYNKIKLSTSQFGFTSAPEHDLAITGPITGADFSSSSASFTHKASLDFSAYPAGTFLFVRVYVNDGSHTANAEIPSDGTSEPMLSYFTLKVVP